MSRHRHIWEWRGTYGCKKGLVPGAVGSAPRVTTGKQDLFFSSPPLSDLRLPPAPLQEPQYISPGESTEQVCEWCMDSFLSRAKKTKRFCSNRCANAFYQAYRTS